MSAPSIQQLRDEQQAILEENGLTVEEARRLFCYTPSTGVVIHKIKKSALALAAQPAGSVNGRGYLHTEVNGVKRLNHRLAWCLFYGAWPAGGIDHIDRNPLNNRIENLRIATHEENMRNVGISSRNKSGIRGVSWDKQSGKWVANIRFCGATCFIGSFENLEAAAEARRVAESEAWGIKHGTIPDG